MFSDRVEQLGLGRYVDLPVEDDFPFSIKARESFDSHINAFEHKLISLCKGQDMVFVNGRLEPGRFTCITQAGASLVDYFITQKKLFQHS